MKEQPNFEDERTLLTARRVVPLKKLEAQERHRKQWLLGGAFAIAMLLGAASALLATYMKLRDVPMKLRDVPVATAELSEVESQPAPDAVAENSATSELPAVENTEEAPVMEESVAPVTPKKAPIARRRATEHLNTELVRPRIVREGDEDEQLDRIREAVLIDAWQERRARRAARRERRNRLNHYDRDLSNLDEIFEGRRQRP